MATYNSDMNKFSSESSSPAASQGNSKAGARVGRSVAVVFGLLLGLGLALLYASRAQAAEPLEFVETFRNLDRFQRPIFLTAVDDGSDRLYVVEQRGMIWSFRNAPEVSERKLVLDITDRVTAAGHGGNNEEGLLGLAFHPQLEEKRAVYLYYSAGDPRRSVVSRFKFDPDEGTIDPDSESVVMTVRQPWGNHNGGMMAFGPDGMLYISLGDGGSANDPQGNGQNLKTLLGSILRIDIDRQDEGKAYAVPPDNPFVGRSDAQGEIWAYGLRNVWRFSFDRETGDLWAGDVGQGKWEEIDLITKGGNYGWDFMEGTHPFENTHRAPTGLIGPVVEYSHREGVSVTGGYVYRGSAVPAAKGLYFYGDFGTSHIWYLRYEDGRVVENVKFSRAPQLASFGEDAAGELYAVSLHGRIYRLQAKQ